MSNEHQPVHIYMGVGDGDPLRLVVIPMDGIDNIDDGMEHVAQGLEALAASFRENLTFSKWAQELGWPEDDD